MKSIKQLLLGIICLLSFSVSAKAQYYEIANQIPNMISPILSGSFKYKGFVDAAYLKGVGDEHIDFVEIATTQGFQYASWFYMGVGAGVDIAFSEYTVSDDLHHDSNTETGVMIPLYTDFRFNIGNKEKTSAFIDLRLGASFLLNNDFPTQNGYLTNHESFYFKPSIGVRIPINKNNSKQALNIGVSYQLTTFDMYDLRGRYYSDKVFNNVGATVSFEW